MATNSLTSNLRVFLVGGAVRDELLGRKVVERDYLVVGTTPEKMLSLGFTPVGKDFPVFLHPKTKEEYALARTERKQGKGYTGFVCYSSPDVTIEEDLIRRDLTVNAMAKDESGAIIDPFNGQQDLNDKVLRHVSDAFVEDPLRVLRVARFAARYFSYGFTIAEETKKLMTDISLSGELEALSSERIWKEMQRSIEEGHPEVFFQTLRECKALNVIWPSLDKLWGIPNPPQWHPEICTGVHTMMVLQQAVKLSNKPEIRFAAICHDLGKGLSCETKLPSHPGHEQAGLPLVEEICTNLRVPNNYKSLSLKACEFHLHIHKIFELKPAPILKMFNRLDIWRKPDEFSDFLLVCQADFNGRTGFEERPYPQAKYLREVADAARSVNAQDFIKKGIQGRAIKAAMEQAKLQEIANIKEKWALDK